MFLHVLADFLQIMVLLLITADHFPKHTRIFLINEYISADLTDHCFFFLLVLILFACQLAEAYRVP